MSTLRGRACPACQTVRTGLGQAGAVRKARRAQCSRRAAPDFYMGLGGGKEGFKQRPALVRAPTGKGQTED